MMHGKTALKFSETDIYMLSDSCTGLEKPGGFQAAEAPRAQDILHMKVVRLSALSTGRLYTHEISLVPSSLLG
jgi:hypothetical protein